MRGPQERPVVPVRSGAFLREAAPSGVGGFGFRATKRKEEKTKSPGPKRRGVNAGRAPGPEGTRVPQEGRGRPGRSGSWPAKQENPLLETRLSPGQRRCAATGSETDMGCARPSLFLPRKPRPLLSPALRPMGASSWPRVSFAGPPPRGASLGALGAPPRHLPRTRETPIP